MAWQPPQEDREFALHSGLHALVSGLRQERAVQAPMAPIDRASVNPQGSSMTQGQNEQSGMLSGPMIPGSTSATTPVGQTEQIHMRVNPHFIHGKVQHSLSQALLK